MGTIGTLPWRCVFVVDQYRDVIFVSKHPDFVWPRVEPGHAPFGAMGKLAAAFNGELRGCGRAGACHGARQSPRHLRQCRTGFAGALAHSGRKFVCPCLPDHNAPSARGAGQGSGVTGLCHQDLPGHPARVSVSVSMAGLLTCGSSLCRPSQPFGQWCFGIAHRLQLRGQSRPWFLPAMPDRTAPCSLFIPAPERARKPSPHR